MFKGIGSLMGLMKNMGKVQEEAEKLQQRLAAATVEGAAGGGMVTVKMSGKMEVISCAITEDAWKLNDRELLEDLLRGAVNQAIEKAKQLAAEETSKMTQALGLPGGLPGNLDDLSGMMGS
jgi:DNA-binding YbaB/EbfC family protein